MTDKNKEVKKEQPKKEQPKKEEIRRAVKKPVCTIPKHGAFRG